jgi:hypothetical protein
MMMMMMPLARTCHRLFVDKTIVFHKNGYMRLLIKTADMICFLPL